jgi:precorrin-6B methylase 2
MTAPASPTVSPTTIMRHASSIFSPTAMLAGIQLGVFTALEGRPLTAEAVAKALKVRSDKLAPLLYALVAAELLTLTDDRFGNSPEADAYLVKGRRFYISEAFWADIWPALLKTAATIRAGAPQALHDYNAMSDEELANFYGGGHTVTEADGAALARRHDFSRFRRLLDVGGGSGGVAIGACQVCPELSATVAELASVIPHTERFIASADASARISTLIADLVAAPAPGVYDVAVVRNLVQVLSLQDASAMLSHVAASLEPGAAIFVLGAMMEDSRLSPAAAVGQNLVFLNVYDDGRIFTESEYRALLAGAGFVDISLLSSADARLPGGSPMISGRLPG